MSALRLTRLWPTGGSAQTVNEMNSKRRLHPPSQHLAYGSRAMVVKMPVKVTNQRTDVRHNNNNSSTGVGRSEPSESNDVTTKCAHLAVTYIISVPSDPFLYILLSNLINLHFHKYIQNQFYQFLIYI